MSTICLIYPTCSDTFPDTRCPVCGIVWKNGGTKPQGEYLEECSNCREQNKEYELKIMVYPAPPTTRYNT